MKADTEFLFELVATYAEKHSSIYRQSILRRFPTQAAELRELFNLTDWLVRFFARQGVTPDPAFRAELKAHLMAEYERHERPDQSRATAGVSDEMYTVGAWELPQPNRRWTAVGTAVAVAGVLAAYWRNRDVAA